MATRPTVLVTETLDEMCAGWLAERAEVRWARAEQGQTLDSQLAQADALIVRTYTQVNDALLDRAPRVRVVGRAGVGLDNIDLPACQRRGIPVVSTPDANTQAVVEYVLGLILDVHRPRTLLPPRAAAETFHTLRKTEVGRQLSDMTLGIVGFGRIGKRLGAVAHSLGMNLIVNDILPEADLRRAVSYPFTFAGKEELYGKSEIVTIHVDGRPENHHLIDAEALAMLRPDCLLINAARGMLVDALAVATWARQVESRGGGAILDVHDPEPPPLDYPLYGLPNVRLLPHLASRTDTALRNMSWVVRDVWAVLEGREPQFPAW